MTARFLRQSCASPNHAGLWIRLGAALLFAFYVNYTPAHLATAAHFDHAGASIAHDHPHDDHDHHQGDHHDSDRHTPHHASDHTLILAAAAKPPSAPAPAVYFLPAIIALLASEPESHPPIPVFERIRPPGESPPDPRQPRGPPPV